MVYSMLFQLNIYYIYNKYSILLYTLFNNQSIVRILVPSMKDQLNYCQTQTVLYQKDESQIKIIQEKMPVITFDTQKFDVILNGQPVVYENQVLTLQGLQIINKKNNMQLDLGIEFVRAELKPSIQYDTKLNQVKYCYQLAKALDRASNSVYLSRKKKRNVSSSPAGYCLQICQYIVRKIPLKSRCFQKVFNNLQLHKINLLFESNSFFLQVLKFICQILFKVNIQDININTRQAFPSQNSQYFASYVNQKHQGQHKIDNSQKAQRFKKTQQKIKIKNNSHVSQYQTKVLMVFEDIRQKIGVFKLSFQRINLLLSIFTRQNRLSTFLYQLNRQLIIKELKDFLPKTLITDSPTRTNNIKILNSLISLIKTTNTSLGKSQRSFQILTNILLENGLFSKWLKVNIEFISSTYQCSHILLQLLYLIAEINPKEITNIYLPNQHVLNCLVFSQVQWIYETLNFNYQTEQKQKQLHEKAYTVLDNLINICKITVKQTTSAINFGRIICKSICDIATKLRPCDLEALTYVCIVNSFSRQIILKYLFGYFRKFIRNIKNTFKINLSTAVKTARQNKSFLLQIMQSIRQIASIESIEFSIESELLSDIQLILDTACPKNKLLFDSSNNKKWKGNCLTSAYEEMIKNITIVKLKQKQNISHEFKYVEQ